MGISFSKISQNRRAEAVIAPIFSKRKGSDSSDLNETWNDKPSKRKDMKVWFKCCISMVLSPLFTRVMSLCTSAKKASKRNWNSSSMWSSKSISNPSLRNLKNFFFHRYSVRSIISAIGHPSHLSLNCILVSKDQRGVR